MNLTYIPLFLMAAILALIVILPLLSREMPNYPDRREKEPD
jgi:hypothetical protein